MATVYSSEDISRVLSSGQASTVTQAKEILASQGAKPVYSSPTPSQPAPSVSTAGGGGSGGGGGGGGAAPERTVTALNPETGRYEENTPISKAEEYAKVLEEVKQKNIQAVIRGEEPKPIYQTAQAIAIRQAEAKGELPSELKDKIIDRVVVRTTPSGTTTEYIAEGKTYSYVKAPEEGMEFDLSKTKDEMSKLGWDVSGSDKEVISSLIPVYYLDRNGVKVPVSPGVASKWKNEVMPWSIKQQTDYEQKLAVALKEAGGGVRADYAWKLNLITDQQLQEYGRDAVVPVSPVVVEKAKIRNEARDIWERMSPAERNKNLAVIGSVTYKAPEVWARTIVRGITGKGKTAEDEAIDLIAERMYLQRSGQAGTPKEMASTAFRQFTESPPGIIATSLVAGEMLPAVLGGAGKVGGFVARTVPGASKVANLASRISAVPGISSAISAIKSHPLLANLFAIGAVETGQGAYIYQDMKKKGYSEEDIATALGARLSRDALFMTAFSAGLKDALSKPKVRTDFVDYVESTSEGSPKRVSVSKFNVDDNVAMLKQYGAKDIKVSFKGEQATINWRDSPTASFIWTDEVRNALEKGAVLSENNFEKIIVYNNVKYHIPKNFVIPKSRIMKPGELIPVIKGTRRYLMDFAGIKGFNIYADTTVSVPFSTATAEQLGAEFKPIISKANLEGSAVDPVSNMLFVKVPGKNSYYIFQPDALRNPEFWAKFGSSIKNTKIYQSIMNTGKVETVTVGGFVENIPGETSVSNAFKRAENVASSSARQFGMATPVKINYRLMPTKPPISFMPRVPTTDELFDKSMGINYAPPVKSVGQLYPKNLPQELFFEMPRTRTAGGGEVQTPATSFFDRGVGNAVGAIEEAEKAVSINTGNFGRISMPLPSPLLYSLPASFWEERKRRLQPRFSPVPFFVFAPRETKIIPNAVQVSTASRRKISLIPVSVSPVAREAVKKGLAQFEGQTQKQERQIAQIQINLAKLERIAPNVKLPPLIPRLGWINPWLTFGNLSSEVNTALESIKHQLAKASELL
jgi:hypothetical protein